MTPDNSNPLHDLDVALTGLNDELIHFSSAARCVAALGQLLVSPRLVDDDLGHVMRGEVGEVFVFIGDAMLTHARRAETWWDSAERQTGLLRRS